MINNSPTHLVLPGYFYLSLMLEMTQMALFEETLEWIKKMRFNTSMVFNFAFLFYFCRGSTRSQQVNSEGWVVSRAEGKVIQNFRGPVTGGKVESV
jgi:hypothetical protein